MRSRRIIRFCDDLVEDIITNGRDVNLCAVDNAFYLVYKTRNPNSFTDNLIRISRLAIEQRPSVVTVLVLKRAIQRIVFVSVRDLKGVIRLVQHILKEIAPDPWRFNRYMIAAFMDVIDDVLWKVPMHAGFRLHVICHFIWALKPILWLRMNGSYVAEMFFHNFVHSLRRCKEDTVLTTSKLYLLREVVSLMTTAILIHAGPIPIDEIIEPAFTTCHIEMRWIVWWGICRGFFRKIHGCYRHKLTPNEEIFFDGLIYLSGNLEREKPFISPIFREEIVNFQREFRAVYTRSHQEQFLFRRNAFDINICVQSGCDVSLNGIQRMSDDIEVINILE